MSTQKVESQAVKAAKALATQLGQNPTMTEGACLLSLPELSGTSGRITLREAEMRVDGHTVTGQSVRNGDLEVFPASELQPFNTLRIAAKRIIAQHSVELGGKLFLCPIKRLDVVVFELEELKNKFDRELASLKLRYDSILEAHKKKNPSVAHLIARHQMVWDEFVKPFGFKLNPVLAVSPLMGDVDGMAASAADQLWKELASDARAQHRTSIAGKEGVSQRAVKALLKIRDKLINLSFLHSGIDRFVDEMNEIFISLPKTGEVKGHDLLKLSHLVLFLSNEENLRLAAEGKYAIPQPDEPEVEEPEEIEAAEADEVTWEEDVPFSTDEDFDPSDVHGFDEFQIPPPSAGLEVLETGWGSF